MIDLTHDVENNMQTFPKHWHIKTRITQLGTINKEHRETKKIEMSSHAGTHVDAPLHFIKNGKTIDKINIKLLYGDALLIDFSKLKFFHEISLEQIKKKIKKPPLRLVLRFDWDIKAYKTKKFYSHHPYLSPEVCRWLVKGGCKLLGMDTPQIDNPNIKIKSKFDAQNHKILLGKNVLLVEYLKNLRKIKKKKFKLIVAPLKIKNSDGAPARCFAI